MPVTFPAHQGFVAAAKLKWPALVDGTALCIGAAAPDLGYALGSWMAQICHSALGVVVWALPFTLVASEVTRRWAATGIFSYLPDLGPLRVRSYGVLAFRRPNRLSTLVSAAVGSGSHVLIDSFAHDGRWGATLAGLNSVLFSLPGVGAISGATLVQYLGHGLGIVAFLLVLVEIAGGKRLEAWYGADVVEKARARQPSAGELPAFWTAVITTTLAAVAGAVLVGGSILFVPILALTVAVLLAGAAMPRIYR